MTDAEYEAWYRTGKLRCDDCGTLVRCSNLTSLPPHRCTERQRARRERAASE